MNPCELTVAITALANSIACRITDNEKLALVASALVQLGDTLETIVVQRERCAHAREKSENLTLGGH